MKLETILNAFELVCRHPDKWNYRQRLAFRARILRMFEEKDKRIDMLCAEHDFLMDGSKELKTELDEKDAEIDRWKGKYKKMVSGWNEAPR